ncbi:hypothetical protein LWI28_029273 [Acer negundo]|uniref:ABC1 atypical kinase-like domain-containing protein n=1 Tax=Acer negundo TaxID=4023 RepID=A0AAD5NIC4_ACENE|nr:hypothetical protein LWI28_029273 [Acer negundo]
MKRKCKRCSDFIEAKTSQRFPSLKRMFINSCQQLEALPRILTLDSLEQSREFPCPRKLSVSGCHNLIELPSFFPSLTMLEIDGCQELIVLPKLPSIINLELNKCESKVLQSIIGSASLTYMRICKISNLECLFEGYLKHFTSLEELQISHLEELATLSNEIGLQSLLSLKLLEISGYPFLKELPQYLYKLSSLKVLRIWNCPSLVSFPVTGLQSTLIGLEIKSFQSYPAVLLVKLTEKLRDLSRVSTDFIQEAKNSERTAEKFRNNDVVRVPQVFWDFTTSQVLTMEFCQGCKVDDLKVLKEIKVNPIKVAKALVEVFAEMIFIHGFVHGDPHPGNILVSPEGQNGFSLVLLDHGTYRTLDEAFRVNYCQLWKALILLDSNKIQHLGEQFGVGKYSIYFPLIFTGRTINSNSVLGTGMSVEEKRQLKHDINSLKFEDISSFMESLPPNFLAILRTDGLLRSIIRRLGAPQRIRLLAYAKYALYGLSPKCNPKSDFAVNAMYYRFKAMANYLQLKLVLETLELLSWIGKFKQFVLALLRKITGISTSFLTICLTGTVQH